MRELFSFFTLYIDDSLSSLGVTLIMLYGNAIFYIIDFYSLVKKKSYKETTAIMAIPVTLSVMGSAVLGMLVHIPGLEKLEKFASALQDKKLHFALCVLALLYGILWTFSFLIHRIYQKKDSRRFVLSCILDYLCIICILSGSISVLIQFDKSFFLVIKWILWLYLHAIYLLSCKIILLAAGLVVQIYCTRLTMFRWREGKSTSAFLFRYYAFYQNAIVRSILLFELGILIPLTIALAKEGWNLQATGIMGFLYLGGAFVILVSLSPCMKILHLFKQWGNPSRMREIFCREYFCEDAIFRNKNFTVTRHFLIDEQTPAAVYYWPLLNKVGNWIYDKKGRSRTLWFSDGTFCKFSEDEVLSSEQVFQYARKISDSEQIYFDRIEGEIPKTGVSENRYDSFVKKMAIYVVFLIMFANLFFQYSPNSGRQSSQTTSKRESVADRDPDFKADFDNIYLVKYISYEYGGKNVPEDALAVKREYNPYDYDPAYICECYDTSYFYDQEGRLVYEEYAHVGSDDEYNVMRSSSYEYTEDGCIKTEISDYWSYKRISTMDTEGNVILYDSIESQQIGSSSRSYDEKGRLLLQTTLTQYTSKKDEVYCQLKVKWDDIMHTGMAMQFDELGGDPTMVWIDFYSEDGKKLHSVYSGYQELTGLSWNQDPEELKDYCYRGYWASYDAGGHLMECAEQGGKDYIARILYNAFRNDSYSAYSYNGQGLKEWEYSCFDQFLYLTHYLYDSHNRLTEEFKYRIYLDEWQQELSDGSILTFTKEDGSIKSICRRSDDGELINELIYDDGGILLQHTEEGEISWREAKTWVVPNTGTGSEDSDDHSEPSQPVEDL